MIDGRFGNITALTLDNSGKILVAYYSTLLRYNADGTPDNSFGPSTSNEVNTPYTFYDLAVDSSGRILGAGVVYNGNNGSNFAVARYDSTGALDTTFGTSDADGINGLVSVDFGSSPTVRSEESVSDILIDAAGKILIGGYSYAYLTTGSANVRDQDFVLARLNANGSLDTTFGVGSSLNSAATTTLENIDGVVFTDSGSWENIQSLAIDSQGRIIAGGTSLLTRYSASGTLDLTFDTDGRVYAYSGVQALAIDSSDRIVSGGYNSLTRLKTDGTLDNTLRLAAHYIWVAGS